MNHRRSGRRQPRAAWSSGKATAEPPASVVSSCASWRGRSFYSRGRRCNMSDVVCRDPVAPLRSPPSLLPDQLRGFRRDRKRGRESINGPKGNHNLPGHIQGSGRPGPGAVFSVTFLLQASATGLKQHVTHQSKAVRNRGSP